MNRMILNETAWFGRGSLAALTDEVTRRGYQKALVVTDKILLECGVATRLISRLEQAGLDFAIFDAVKPNPTISIVQQGVDAFRQSGADYLIALGGDRHRIPVKLLALLSITLSLPMCVVWKVSQIPVSLAYLFSLSLPLPGRLRK